MLQDSYSQQPKTNEDIPIQQMMHQMMQMINQIGERLDRLENRATGTAPKLKNV